MVGKDRIRALVEKGHERAAELAERLGPGFTIMVTTCAVLPDPPYEGKRDGALYSYTDGDGNEVEFCVGDLKVVGPTGPAVHYWWEETE